MTDLGTPIIAVVIGEGGSGGALALGVADVVLAFESSVYSVITPEGCAAILWRSATESEKAAKALRSGAPDLLDLGIVDALVPEPPGGAHEDPPAMAASLRTALLAQLAQLSNIALPDLLAARYDRFRGLGVYNDPGAIEAERAKPWWRRALDRAGVPS